MKPPLGLPVILILVLSGAFALPGGSKSDSLADRFDAWVEFTDKGIRIWP